jgi:hypothetical protein
LPRRAPFPLPVVGFRRSRKHNKKKLPDDIVQLNFVMSGTLAVEGKSYWKRWIDQQVRRDTAQAEGVFR